MDIRELEHRLLEALAEDFKDGGMETHILTREETGMDAEVLRTIVTGYGTENEMILAECMFIGLPQGSEDTLYYSVLLTLPTEMDKKSMPALFEAVAKLNFYMTGGSFAIDPEESILVFKQMAQLPAEYDFELLHEQINITAAQTIQLCEPYAGLICGVAEGRVPLLDVLALLPSNPQSDKAGAAPDYSKGECWYQIPKITKGVDTFFVYPTEYMAANEGDPDYAPLDNPEMLEGVKFDHLVMASAFEDSTNLFMPYYRQAGMSFVGKAGKESDDPRAVFATIPYDDITAALDYYFENFNEGRPFIIAGHSQGSGILSLVLMRYFKEHPEYYKRMVCAYVIGFSITKEYLEANPHLKFATGESDTGVIISWNTEGPKNVEQNAKNIVVLPNAISINPLNWKRDETYAPASENLGSMVVNEETNTAEIADIGVDAQVVLERGVILTHTDCKTDADPDYFGPQSYHENDYMFFYNNIKDNVAKRIAAFL